MTATAASTLPRHDLPTWIDGREVAGERQFDVHYPYTGEVIGSAPRLTREEVAAVLDRGAELSFSLSRHERAQILNRIADLLHAEEDDFATLITLESGLALKDTRYEMRRAQDVFRFAAMEALRDDGQVFACDTSANGKNRRAYTLREPLRLVAAITPFNHPLNQVAHKVAPSIATNNVMVLKPSSRTPLSALRLARVMREAGLPDGMVTMVTGDAEEIGPVLVDATRRSTWSASPAAPRSASASPTRLGYRRAILELGGNDPLIVLRDADLDEAVRLATYGAFKNSGQRCTAVKRIIVEEPLADAFAAGIAAAAAKLKVGDPLDPETDIGTVIADTRRDRVRAADERGSSPPARRSSTAASGAAPRSPRPCSTMCAPRWSSSPARRSAPTRPIIRVPDLDAAIATANTQDFGLSSGVVTNDLRAINRCIRELRFGTVNIREVPGYRTELTPFGGTKDSGLGVKEGVIEAMKAMTFTKLYTLPWD